MGRLQDKIVLLTGGAMGIGRTTAKRLASEGATIVFTDIDREAGEETAAALGENVSFVEQDVTQPEDWKRVI
ncbi:MAG: SDR family NAD(P)-dependent oxidoreductase, partial [Pseudomonadota bacterium]